MTRVTAKYIRKLAKAYEIEITEPLRSNATKEKWVEIIASAIIAEQARIKCKEEVETFKSEVENNLGNFYTMSQFDSFNMSCAIYYLPERKLVGFVFGRLNAQYRFANDGKMVARIAASVPDAVDLVISNHITSIRQYTAV